VAVKDEKPAGCHLLVVQLEPSTGLHLRHALMDSWTATLGVRSVTDLSVLYPALTLSDVEDFARKASAA
jgi:hypothetical protein